MKVTTEATGGYDFQNGVTFICWAGFCLAYNMDRSGHESWL
jgi:hypothetical protein